MMRAAVLSLSLTAVHAQDLFLGKSMASPLVDVDVIIVGAGWAGMAAADSLARANVSFVVLEADTWTGGRSHAIEFGDPSVGKVVFEEGANWVSGDGGLNAPYPGGAAGVTKDAPNAQHPVHKLALQEDLRMAFIPGGADGNMSNYAAIFDPEHHNADPDGALRHRATAAIDCLNSTKAQGANARTRLESCGWFPKTDTEWAMDWAMTSDSSGEPAEKTGGLGKDPTYQWWGPNDWFVIDQHPRGFARLIDGMVRDSVPSGDPRVIFNAHVAKIEWGCDGVLTSTKDGRTFKGKHVITTVSLGVLKKHHGELFSPPLPKGHADALSDDHVVMGNLSHVLLQFPKVWWDNSLPRWVSANRGGHSMSGYFNEWQNLNHDSMVPGSQTLLSFLADPAAKKFEAMKDADVQAAAVQRLRIQNPDAHIPDPVAMYISRWGTNDKFYGSYSHFEPGRRPNFFKNMQQPLQACGKNVVRFAGEGLCNDLSGYTHGGYQTGKESAARYLYETHRGPNPDDDDTLKLCNW